MKEFVLSEIIPPKCICMYLFSSLVYKDIQVHTHTHTHTHLHTINAPFFKLTEIFLLITPTRSCLLTCLLYSSLKDSKLFKEFLLFSYFSTICIIINFFLFLHQWLKYRNIAYYSTNARLLLLLLVIVSQSWITHVCADVVSRYKIQDGFSAFSCIQLYTYMTLFTYTHAQY